jgi:hypothetical protein
VKNVEVIEKSPPFILTKTSTFSFGPIDSKLGVSAESSYSET